MQSQKNRLTTYRIIIVITLLVTLLLTYLADIVYTFNAFYFPELSHLGDGVTIMVLVILDVALVVELFCVKIGLRFFILHK